MRRLHFRTRNLVILAVVAMPLFSGCGAYIPQHDHALSFTGSTPPDTAIYCGVQASPQMAVPYTLYVGATAIGSAGAFRITFRDRSSMVFPVPVGTTLSTTHVLGRTPGKDDVVKITAEGGVQSMMASVSAGGYDEDPFDEPPAQSDNFCITAPREPGSASAARIIP